MKTYSRSNFSSFSGYIVDLPTRTIFPGTVQVEDGKIVSVTRDKEPKQNQYILPGFIDSHIHIESSMLIPSEFARLASVHGTVATISDPHEIANVLGIEGVRYMIQNGKKVPFHFYFGASPCVPATIFETAGAVLTADDIEELFVKDDLKYLSEMMNYPGVLHRDPEVMNKIAIAKRLGKPVDGHAPGLRGEEAQKYIDAGISTDHECFTLDEALDKVQKGMHIIIREGSAAKNFDALHTLLESHPNMVMFCSDDKHPHELVEGHINQTVVRALNLGYDLFNVLYAACYHPILHYGLDVGILQKGDNADFIIVEDLKNFKVLKTYVKGVQISKNGKSLIQRVEEKAPNHFSIERKDSSEFAIASEGETIHVIQPEDGQLVTKDVIRRCESKDNKYVCSPENNLLKIVVVNRYNDAPPAVAFVENFGLKKGAIASCIAHDSHNIIAVGCSDEDISAAVNAIIDNRGGISISVLGISKSLPLPVAGIMSNEDGYEIAQKYSDLDKLAKSLGSTLDAPFMTLSFMALLVIPDLKLSDKGLFSGKTFSFITLHCETKVKK